MFCVESVHYTRRLLAGCGGGANAENLFAVLRPHAGNKRCLSCTLSFSTISAISVCNFMHDIVGCCHRHFRLIFVVLFSVFEHGLSAGGYEECMLYGCMVCLARR